MEVYSRRSPFGLKREAGLGFWISEVRLRAKHGLGLGTFALVGDPS